MAQKTAAERKRGNRLGFWFFRTALGIFGLGGAYSLLYVVALYYALFDSGAVETGMAYVRRRFPEHGGLRRRFDVYRLFASQGKSLIDRYYLIAGGDKIGMQIQGYEALRTYLAEGNKGVILLTAHVGNWQVAMTALRRFNKTVYLMMRPEDNAAVKATLGIGSDERVKILSTDDSLGGVVEALKALNRGDLVSIMGDRTYGYSSLPASFLGGEVRFPHGAFSIAAAAQCPVVVLLSAKVSARKYIVDVSHMINPPSAGRTRKREEAQECIQQFARILEEYAAQYPYQWFVFRDMWKGNE